MPDQEMLPQQQAHPPDVQHVDAPQEATPFGITKLGLKSFDELINKSAQKFGVEFELFFSNSLGTQHGCMKIVNGKVVKTIPLIEFSVETAKLVMHDGAKLGYIVKHYRGTKDNMGEEFIPITVIEKRKLCKHLKLPPQVGKAKDDLCERLVQTLILEKAAAEKHIEVGLKQGWNIVAGIHAYWESRWEYPSILHNVIPESIACRDTAKCRMGIYKGTYGHSKKFHDIFQMWPELKIHFLIRLASYNLTFAGKFGIFFDQIIAVSLTDTADNSLLTALYDNVTYGRGKVSLLSKTREIEKVKELLNDAILLAVDDTRPDEIKAHEGSINALHSMVLDSKRICKSVPVVLSSYATAQMRTELYCDFSNLNGAYDISPAVLTEILEGFDVEYIARIKRHYAEYRETFDRNIKGISAKTPYMIPAHRRNVYYILIATLRTYDEHFGVFFDEETELRLVDILSAYDEVGSSNDELLLTLFGKYLNEEIGNVRFKIIKRIKYIVFDEGTNTVIVDDNNIYIETSVIKELALSKMKLHSVNLLTEILKAYACLAINDHNSKCYRFHVQNSNGESYMLYTYGISKLLINAENRKRLELADYQKFLLDYADFEDNDILPLGVTSDGHYVGKDVSYRNKSNDSMFITGQSGRGKSFCTTNLLPSLAMLGSHMLVLDVSRSFTRDEVLRALPEEVVSALFEFIDIGGGQGKLPVNPLFIGDCSNRAAKKRRIMGFIKAICKLDKDEIKIVEGIISDMLKKAPTLTAVSIEVLRNTLKRGSKVGNKVFSLISATIDDIELIGFEEQGWGEFFEKSKKIPVILLGDETDEKVHPVLDVLVASAFAWQRDHNTAPLSVVIDEIKMQNFSEGSPLHTILTQGRKFNTKLVGMTQQYISTGSHAIDVMKEAGIKIFFRPAKSLDRIAVELEYKNPADAGFGSMGIGDFILSCDAFNKVDGVNEELVIHCKTIKFVDTPLYKRFKTEYHLT